MSEGRHERFAHGIEWASPDWHQARAEMGSPDPEASARYQEQQLRRALYGQEGCDLCNGLGHIVEIRRIVGPRIEVEIRPFDVDTEQRPDEGEVWVCPNCFWAVQKTTDPLVRRDRVCIDCEQPEGEPHLASCVVTTGTLRKGEWFDGLHLRQQP